MRKSVLLLAILLTLLPAMSRAQNYIVPTTQGTVLEYAIMEPDGTVTGFSVRTVESVQKTAKGTLVTVVTEIFDEKHNRETEMSPIRETILVTADKIIKLKDGSADFLKDMVMKAVLRREKLKNEDIEIDLILEGDDTAYPPSPSPGQKLSNVSVTVHMRARNKNEEERVKLMTISTTDRLVGETETIKTNAGDFKCVKISKTVKMKVAMGLFSKSQRMITWYAPGVGEVMTQEVTKRGKVESTTKLIAIKHAE